MGSFWSKCAHPAQWQGAQGRREGILELGRRPGKDMGLWGGAGVGSCGAGRLPGGPPSWASAWEPQCPKLCRPWLSGPPPPLILWHISCRAPAQPRVGTAPSGPIHSPPAGPLWLGPVPTPGPSRPPRWSQARPPAPAHTETTWRGCTGMALVRHVRQVSGWRDRQPDRWTDGTSQPPLHLHGRCRDGGRGGGPL